LENIVLDFIYLFAGQYTAYLHFLSKRHNIRPRFFAEMLMAPKLTCEANACLYLIINQHRFVFVGKYLKVFKKLLPYMIIAALGLNWFDYDGADVILMLKKCALNFRDR